MIVASGSVATSDYSVLGGSVGFTKPAEWREVARTDRDSSAYVAFVVPRPLSDTSAPAGNVIVDVALSYGRRDLKTYSDAKVARLAGGPGNPTIVESRYWPGDSSRTVLWSSTLRDTPYVLWDKLAVRDSIYIDVRTAIPASYSADSAWHTAYQTQLDALINSVCAGKRPLFPSADAHCPNVEHVIPFTRAENADGAWFVWLVNRRAGLPYPYLASKDFPTSTNFSEVSTDSARDGDVAWWPSFVAIFSATSRALQLPEGETPLSDYTRRMGSPRFYRRLVPK